MAMPIIEAEPDLTTSCHPWCAGPAYHDASGTQECAGEVVEVIPGLVAWPIAAPGERTRFVVATIRPDVTVDSLDLLQGRLVALARTV